MATKQDIRNEGFRRGQAIASWIDLPEIGTRIPRDIDYVGHEIVTAANQFDVWEMLCHASEENARQFSPFEFTANDLNELAETKPYDVWQVFDDGIAAGIGAYGRKHHKAALAAAAEE